MAYYHVCKQWDGGDLLPLARLMRDECAAIETYLERWPEAGELALEHVHWVHMYDSLDQAKDHVIEYGGEILEISDEITVARDRCEFDHPMAREIPAWAIRRLKEGQ
jgi:hypothetical protein